MGVATRGGRPLTKAEADALRKRQGLKVEETPKEKKKKVEKTPQHTPSEEALRRREETIRKARESMERRRQTTAKTATGEAPEDPSDGPSTDELKDKE